MPTYTITDGFLTPVYKYITVHLLPSSAHNPISLLLDLVQSPTQETNIPSINHIRHNESHSYIRLRPR